MIDIINRLERGLEPAVRPLGAAIGRAIVDMTAPASPALKPYVRPDGTKVPHMFVDQAGKMVNLTPPPADLAPTAPVCKTWKYAVRDLHVASPDDYGYPQWDVVFRNVVTGKLFLSESTFDAYEDAVHAVRDELAMTHPDYASPESCIAGAVLYWAEV